MYYWYFLLGEGFLGGICKDNHKKKKTKKIVHIRDDADFRGVSIAAHEVGHVYVRPNYFY